MSAAIEHISPLDLIRIGYEKDPKRCKKHILSALQQFSNLTLNLVNFTGKKDLLCLNGTIPVKYRLVFLIFESYVFNPFNLL